MKIYSYFNPELPHAEGLFDDEWPVQFIREFAEFYKFFEEDEVIILHDTALNAYLPIRIIKRNLLRFGQILHAPTSNREELSIENQSLFFEKMMLFIEREKLVHRLEQPHPYGIMLAVPKGAKYCRFGTYIHDLETHTDESLLNSYDPKYKKAIQHSENNGGTVLFGWEQFEMFYYLYSTTSQRNNFYCNEKVYFEALYKYLGPEHIEVGVIYDKDKPVGAILILYSKYAALCTHAGSTGDTKLYGGMKHLHFEMMKHLKAKGVHRYDLVGMRINNKNPSLEGVFRFKKGFGGVLKEGYLWKAEIDIPRMKIYSFINNVRRGFKQNYPDIIDQETLENK